MTDKRNYNENKVLIITYYWPPSGGGGVQRWVKFCKYLPDFGFEPIVLTVNPDDASYTLLDQSLTKDISPTIKVYKTKTRESLQLFMKLFGRKKLPHSGFSGEKKESLFSVVFRFIRGNFFIPDPRKGWNKYAIEKAAELINQFDIKYVVTSSPPHSTQLIGYALKKRFSITWIADLRDPWTDIFYYKDLMHTSLAKKIDLNFEHKVLTSADKLIVVSPAIKRLFANKLNKEERDKIYIIPNGFDDNDIQVHPLQESQINQWVITYTGNLSANYPGDVFVKILKQLIDQNPTVKIIFRFIGIYPVQLNELINELDLSKSIEYVEYVEHSKIFTYLNNTDALFLAIPEAKNNEGILTGKLFEYLAARKPILCIGPPNGDAAAIISECDAGKTFNRNEEELILNYLQLLIDNHLNNKKLFFNNLNYLNYSRKNLTKQLTELF